MNDSNSIIEKRKDAGMMDQNGKEDVPGPDLIKPRRTALKRLGLILVCIFGFVSLIGFFMLSQHLVLEARIIPAGSMAPTIESNDRVLVNKLVYRLGEPARGDIIVFKPPENIGIKEDLVKRIIGLPGDSIRIDNGKLFINGTLYAEPYILEPMNYRYGPAVVPADSYFVLGDNRNKSFDSRFNWFVPKKNIIGKAINIYWPQEHQKDL